MKARPSAGGSFRLPSRFLLRSRFGQRLLLLFVGCTVIPTATVALISFRTVSGQLDAQSRERLSALASSVGKAFYDRLVLIEADLRKASTGLACRAGSEGAGNPPCREGPLYALDGLALVPDGGRSVRLSGDRALTENIEVSELPHLEPGHSAILVRRDPPGRGRIWLVHRPAPTATDPAAGSQRLVGVVNGDFLWSATEGLPATIAATLWDPDTGTLFSNATESIRLAPAVVRAVGRSDRGTFEWTGNGGAYLATSWSLPLTRRFRVPDWRLVMSESKADVLAPMAEFDRTFPLLLAACAVGVLALGLIQIRRSLVPLQKLQEGTRRIAAQDFDTRVNIASGDEIEELAQAFNAMAGQLGRQFSALRTAAEIDRALLSSVDASSIADTVLARLPAVCRCDALSIAVLDRHGVATTTWVDLSRGGRRRSLGAPKPLAPADLQHLRQHRDHVITPGHDGASVPGYLAHLAEPEAGLIEAFPLFYGDDPLGILALRHSQAPAAAEELPEVRRLADQVAVALANARMVEQVRHMAFYDSLTHLPNRILYKERLSQALVKAQRFRHLVAVCFLDLDHFSTINDTLGHDLGDQLVQDVAARMLACCREGDSLARFGGVAGAVEVARLGGDEFTFILPDIRGPEDAVAVARRILETFAEPFRLGTQEIFVTASIGIAIYPFDGLEVEDLLKNADVAMYHAKEQGRNTFRLFSASMNADVVARMRLEQQLRKAVEAGEFTVWYQPIVDLNSGAVTGAEALVRWQHPERGLVGPSEFISLTEESGLIVPLGLWILRSVCTQAKAWEDAGLGSLRVSVNLSTRQLRQEDLVRTVGQVLAETGLAATSLELELTQSVLMDPGGELQATLEALAGTGIGLAIDDFGTGYSSLNYLKHLPVQTLKIDQSFVREMTSDPEDAAITQAIITLGRALGMTVVAEGVETPEQAALLQSQGCQRLQGYWLGRPMAAPSFEEYLRASREGQPASRVA